MAPINVCRECDTAYAEVELGRGELARCRNCHGVVARHPHTDIFQAQWRVAALAAPKYEVQLCTTSAQVNVAGGVCGMVLGYQQAISIVASGMTGKLLAAADGSDYPCPNQ